MSLLSHTRTPSRSMFTGIPAFFADLAATVVLAFGSSIGVVRHVLADFGSSGRPFGLGARDKPLLVRALTIFALQPARRVSTPMLAGCYDPSMNNERHQSCRVLSVLNLKGGVGKTHTAGLLASVCQARSSVSSLSTLTRKAISAARFWTSRTLFRVSNDCADRPGTLRWLYHLL